MKQILYLLFVLCSFAATAQSVDGGLKTLTASGTDTYTISEALPAAYDPKERFLVRFTNANTGAATLNRATLGAKAIQKAGAIALTSGDIVAGGTYLLSYNGTYYQLVGDGGGSGGYTDEQAQDAVGAMVDGSLTYVDGTPLLQRAALTGDIAASAGSNTTTYNGTVPIAKGGTGQTTATAAYVGLTGYTTTATAAGTTTLTVSSTFNQYFTGTTTQTVTMPLASTMTLGQSFYIVNNSTGVVTVQSSGANTIQAMAANTTMMITCILTSGTGTASWNISYSVSNPMTAVGDIIIGGTVSGGYATPSRLALGTTNYVLSSNGSTVAWAAPGGVSGLTAGRLAVATSSTVIGDYDGLKYDDATRVMTLGYTSSGTNTLRLGVSGNGLIMNNSTGELRIAATTTYFPTFYANNAEKMRIDYSTGSVLIGGTTSDGSTLKVFGSLATAYAAKTGAYTLTSTDNTIEVTSGTHTQTLPTAVGITGREYSVTNTGSGTVTLGTTSSQTFVNVSGTPTTLTLAQFTGVTVKSNGANWIKISGF